jgi:quercetin 2,3-dioxygenase
MRHLEHVVSARPASDGDGVRIHRLAGPAVHALLNPFLMLDEINSDNAADYIGGFPEHPHRGFETITYMKAGRLRHRDHMGNEGIIGPGDVQWLTAGSGVLHSEMPEQQDGVLHGFQLWLNLPAKEKMKPAAYRDIRAAEIISRKCGDSGTVFVIAGQVTVGGQLLTGPMQGLSTEPVLLDVELGAQDVLDLDFSRDNRAFVYVYQGATDQLSRRELGVYEAGSHLHLAAGAEGLQALVICGIAIDEPVVQQGPFVMNTMQEIEQALRDHQNNCLVDEVLSPVPLRKKAGAVSRDGVD